MSTIPKRKQKHSDIEANYRNETKTFWCVPKNEVEHFYLVKNFESKSKRFDVFQNLLNWNRDVSIKSKNFESKPKHLDVFQNFLKQKRN